MARWTGARGGSGGTWEEPGWMDGGVPPGLLPAVVSLLLRVLRPTCSSTQPFALDPHTGNQILILSPSPNSNPPLAPRTSRQRCQPQAAPQPLHPPCCWRAPTQWCGERRVLRAPALTQPPPSLCCWLCHAWLQHSCAHSRKQLCRGCETACGGQARQGACAQQRSECMF